MEGPRGAYASEFMIPLNIVVLFFHLANASLGNWSNKLTSSGCSLVQLSIQRDLFH